MRIPYRNAQRNLAIVWFIGSLLLFIILIIQTLSGHIAAQAKSQEVAQRDIKEIWTWASSAVLPTLTLMITVFVAEVNIEKDKEIDRFYFRLVQSASVTYFIILLLHIILPRPVINNTEIENVNLSKIYIGFIQSIVTGLIAIFFIKKSKSDAG